MLRSTIRISMFVCLFAATFGVSKAHAQLSAEPIIFDVRRSLPLEPDEPVYHDFYINAGPEAGFKKGTFVSVVRAIPVQDPLQNTHQATLNVKIGKLEIIHTEKNITVGRLYSELGNDERAVVEFEAIMIGDKVDMGSITTEAPAKKKRKTAKSDEAPAMSAVVVQATVSAPVAAIAVTPPAAPPADLSQTGSSAKAPPISIPSPKSGDPSAQMPTTPESLPQSLPSNSPPVSV